MGTKGIVIMLFATVMSCGGQVLLKLGVSRIGEVGWNDALLPTLRQFSAQPEIWVGMACYVVATYFMLVALSSIELSVYAFFTSVGYIMIMLASIYLFGEAFSVQRILGSAFVIAGVVLITVA